MHSLHSSSSPNSAWPRRRFLKSSALGAAALTGVGPLPQRAAAAARPIAELRAGAAKANITLPIGAVNGGVILRGDPIRQVHDELHARCLVLDDGVTRLAFVVCDLRMIRGELIDRAKALAAKSLGWPLESMLVSATHTHSAPGLVGLLTEPLDRWYEDFVVLRIADAIRRAAASLAPARIGWGSVDKPEHVFNRRYKVAPGTEHTNPFGESAESVVTNPPAKLKVLGPAGPVDPQLSILSVRHADGRPLALLANYGLHYVGGCAPATASADYFGVFSERMVELLEADAGFVAMMSNGTSGDVNNSDRRKAGERLPTWQKMQTVADDLAQAAAKVCGEIEYRDRVELGVAVGRLDLAVRRPDEARLAWAKDIVAKISDHNRLSRPEVYAEEAIALAAGPERVSVGLQAFRIGELGIAAIPCEMFAETGLEIKRTISPRPTFIIELANAYHGYLPTPQQHALGGYETWPARSSYLEVEASTKIRDRTIELLRES